jgi:hypothetical protein
LGGEERSQGQRPAGEASVAPPKWRKSPARCCPNALAPLHRASKTEGPGRRGADQTSCGISCLPRSHARFFRPAASIVPRRPSGFTSSTRRSIPTNAAISGLWADRLRPRQTSVRRLRPWSSGRLRLGAIRSIWRGARAIGRTSGAARIGVATSVSRHTGARSCAPSFKQKAEPAHFACRPADQRLGVCLERALGLEADHRFLPLPCAAGLPPRPGAPSSPLPATCALIRVETRGLAASTSSALVRPALGS